MQGPTFTIGEEVTFDGDTYVVAGRSGGPYPYRLLSASNRQGRRTRMVLVPEDRLDRMKAYVDAKSDT